MTAPQSPQHPNPYVGPRAFKYGEKLYGRDREVLELLDLLIAERIVLLYSPSGAGKSSLVQAGLIPKLEQESFTVLPVIRVKQELPPDSSGNRYLYSTLLSLEENQAEAAQLDEAALADMSLNDYLARHEAALTASAKGLEGLVLIFDQFEEILTLDPTNQAAKRAFFESVGEALRQPQRWALFSLREDYLAGLDPYLRLIPTRLNTTFRLDLLGETAAREAIQKPAASVGVTFTNAAAAKLVDDLRRVQVQQPDGTIEVKPGLYVEPVQLQVVCLDLWAKAAAVGRIDTADIEQVGDVDTALAGYYAARVQAIAVETGLSERAIRGWCSESLITEQGLRSQVMRGQGQSQGLANAAIQALVDAHLVRGEERRGLTWYELAHDRLINPIQTDNTIWREAHLHLLQRRADLWFKNQQTKELLLHNEDLAEAERWALRANLLDYEEAFLKASQEVRAEEKRERQRVIYIRNLAIGAIIFGCLALAASLVAFWFFNQANQALKTANSRRLAIASLNNLTTDPQLSLLLAHQALVIDDTTEAENALHQALAADRVEQTLPHTAPVISAAFNPADDSHLVTATADGIVTVWNVDGRIEQSFDLKMGIGDVALNHNGTRLAIAAGNRAGVWEGNSGNLLFVLPDFIDIQRIIFSPDNTYIAAVGMDRIARVWEAERGQLYWTSPEQKTPLWGLAFTPDGHQLATSGEDSLIRIWEIGSATPVYTVTVQPLTSGPKKVIIVTLAFSPDGQSLVAGGEDGLVRLWVLSDPSCCIRPTLILPNHTDTIFDVRFSPDGRRLATASADGTARIWDTTTGRELLRLSGHDAPINKLAFDSTGQKLVTASDDHSVNLWNVAAPPGELRTLPVGVDAKGLAFKPDGTYLATAGKDGLIKIWDVSTNQVTREIKLEAPVYKLAFSKDGDWLAAVGKEKEGEQGWVKLWDTTSFTELSTPFQPAAPVFDVTFAPDNRQLAIAGGNLEPGSNQDSGFVSVWDPPNGQAVLTFPPPGRVLGLAFSPDGRQLATAGIDPPIQGVANFWNLTTGDSERPLPSPEGWIFDIAYSPDGQYFATAGADRTVKVWQAASGQLVKLLIGHTQRVIRVAFSPTDNTRLASVSEDGTARLWNIETGQEQLVLYGHQGPVYDVAFSPDGNRLATAGSDGTVRQYTLKLDVLLETAKLRITRSWRPEECKKYLPQEPCPAQP